MGIIHKEEVSSKYNRKKNLLAVENLENSITGPVSCTIPGTSKAELLAARREKTSAHWNIIRRGYPTLLTESPAPPKTAPAPAPPPARPVSVGMTRDSRSAATSGQKSATIGRGRKVRILPDGTRKRSTFKIPNRQPRSRTELQHNLQYIPPPCAEKKTTKVPTI